MNDRRQKEERMIRVYFPQPLAEILEKIYVELARAERLHPWWPSDPVHAAAVLTEEVGEVVKAVLDWTYEDGDIEDVESEAIQTAAMAIRFLQHLDKYEKRPKEDQR